MTPQLRFDKKSNTFRVVNQRNVKTRLTDRQRRERKLSWNRKRNAEKRREYSITTAPPCSRCGLSLVQCECPPLDRDVPQYRDVVLVLDVRTMKTKIEIR